MATRLTTEEWETLHRFELIFGHLVDGYAVERFTADQRDVMRRLGWTKEKFLSVRARLRGCADRLPEVMKRVAVDEVMRLRDKLNAEIDEFELTPEDEAEIEAAMATRDRTLISVQYVALKSYAGKMLRAARAAANDPRLN